jgi:hypothetical protein
MEPTVDVWTQLAEAGRRVTLDHWLESGAFNIADIDEDGIDLSIPSRVYADYYAPHRTAKALAEDLEGRGWTILFFPAEPYETAFIHTRKEARWTLEQLGGVTLDLWGVCQRFDAAFDGWFHISLAEDDEE